MNLHRYINLHNLHIDFRRRLQRLRLRLSRSPDAFLAHTSGVIHVGANTGQERHQYEKIGLKVAWIEPLPHVFDQLEQNLRYLPKQRAYRYLVTDKNDETYRFHVADNHGASSSIFEFKDHKFIWPEVNFEKTIHLTSITLDSLFEKEKIVPTDYDALVLDTQGSELLVLEGAKTLLKTIRYIKTEAPDFESYKGCCLLSDIIGFLEKYGFQEISRNPFRSLEGVGTYYDMVFRKKSGFNRS